MIVMTDNSARVVSTEENDVITLDRDITSVVILDSDSFSIQTEVEAFLHTEEKGTRVVAAGDQGPPGPPGADGSGASVSYDAAETINAYRAVRTVGTDVELADCRQAGDMIPYVGISLNAASVGASVEVKRFGRVVNSLWSWTIDALVFIGYDGKLTQTLPNDAVFAQTIGFADTATSIQLWPREVIEL